MPGPIGELARKVGGMQRLTALLRTPPRTIRGWAHGTPIPGTAQIILEQLCALHLIPYPQEETDANEN
jgi:hypothetical protein